MLMQLISMGLGVDGAEAYSLRDMLVEGGQPDIEDMKKYVSAVFINRPGTNLFSRLQLVISPEEAANYTIGHTYDVTVTSLVDSAMGI